MQIYIENSVLFSHTKHFSLGPFLYKCYKHTGFLLSSVPIHLCVTEGLCHLLLIKFFYSTSVSASQNFVKHVAVNPSSKDLIIYNTITLYLMSHNALFPLYYLFSIQITEINIIIVASLDLVATNNV